MRLSHCAVGLLLLGALAAPVEAQRTKSAKKPAKPSPEAITSQTPASLDSGASLNPLLLRALRDNTLGLEAGDRHAYFMGLWLCREIGVEALAQFAEAFRTEREFAAAQSTEPSPSKFSLFADLFRHPDVYRGRPVTLRGTLRRLVKQTPGDNDLGVKHVYEGWVYAHGSQHNPAVVLFTRRPAGLPTGGDLAEDVQFSGYFLKLYGYQAQDTTRKAPLFVAGEVEWQPQPAATASAPWSVWVYFVLTLAVVAIGWSVWHNWQPVGHRRALPAVLFGTELDYEGAPLALEHQH
jgi:hypothetical protein